MSKKNVTLSDEVITEKEHARRYEEETKKIVTNIYKKIFDVQHECESVIKDKKRGLGLSFKKKYSHLVKLNIHLTNFN